MAFIAKHPGSCGHCGEELQGTRCSYANDRETIVHTKRCLVLFNCGVQMEDARYAD